MAENTNLLLTADAWAEFTIEKWQDKIRKLGVIDQHDLIDSFEHEVVANAGGDISRIEFAFLYYGKFSDMGVGKGVKLDDVGSDYTSRRPRQWYSPVFYSQYKRLVEILAQKYARKAALAIVENIQDNSLTQT